MLTRRLSGKASLGVLVAGVAAVSGALLSRGTTPRVSSSRIIRGPYLQGAPSGSVIVVWFTDAPTEGGLEWREEGGPWIDVKDRGGLERRHQVSLEGIRHGVRYRYRILASGSPMEDLEARREFSFGPSRSDVLKMIAFGDCGSGGREQAALARVMAMEEPLPDLALVVGDLVYPSGADADYDPKFFAIYRPLMSRIPFYAALGNHDTKTRQGSAYFDIFVLPTNGPKELPPESVYSIEPAGVHITVHDSNLSREGLKKAAAPWHLADVRASAARFKIAALHHSPYSSSINSVREPTPIVREILPPAFSATGVDLVLAGHDHVYERTRPLGGVVYVTTGAGGSELYPRMAQNEWTEVFYGDRHSYTTVEVAGRVLSLRQTDLNGCAVDSLVLDKAIGEGDPWRVYSGKVAPPADWVLPGFDDASWPNLPAPLGSAGPDLTTPVPTTSMTGLTLYARHTFALQTHQGIQHALLRIRFDDGFVASLNGIEVARRNVPEGQMAMTPASASHSGEDFETISIPPSLLRTGTNVLAVEVHRRGEADGTFLLGPELTLITGKPGRCSSLNPPRQAGFGPSIASAPKPAS